MILHNLFNGLQQRRPVFYLLAVLLLCVCSVCAFYGLGLGGPPIQSDGFGYYAYLPSIFIYHDISMKWLAKTDLKLLGHYPPFEEGWTGVNKYGSSGRYLNQYGIGVSVMMSPFFLIANELVQIFGLDSNGYSVAYQISAIISGFFYFSLGLIFLFKFLGLYFGKDKVLFTLFVHVMGTGLFFYATLDSTAVPSHLYSFCLVSTMLWVLASSSRHPLLFAIITGFVLGMIFMVRNINILFGIIFALFGIKSFKELVGIIFNKSWWIRMILAGCVFAITILPQLFYWKVVTGNWIVYSYQNVGFKWLSPEILNVLFGFRKGLFIYYPVLIFSVVGFFYLRKFMPEFSLPLLVFFPINVYLISSWHCWWYGGSFGMRPFVESTPLFAMGFCSLLSGIKKKSVQDLLELTSVICCAWTIFYMLLYWFGVLPFDGMNWKRHLWIWYRFDWLFLLIMGTSILLYLKLWKQESLVR